MISHLNFNSVRQRFDSFVEITTRNIDILMISETKLDESFPRGQFLIKRFSETHRLDRNSKGQKQPPRGVLKKRCSENMQQIYRRTPMPKCDINKVA